MLKNRLLSFYIFERNFLKVPSTPQTQSCNSGDSLLSTSSGKVLTATSGGTPNEMISSAPSSGDENDESRFICV